MCGSCAAPSARRRSLRGADGAQLRVVLSGRSGPARARPVGVEEFAARTVHALVGVRAEVIALRLQKVCGKPRGAVALSLIHILALSVMRLVQSPPGVIKSGEIHVCGNDMRALPAHRLEERCV